MNKTASAEVTDAEQAVVIVGAGPTGLMLAGELALAGIEVAVLERRPDQELLGSRASGLHSRTLEVLGQRGIADRFLLRGTPHPVVGFHGPLDIRDFPTRHNYVLALRQNYIERILADWIQELGVSVHRQSDVRGFTQDPDGIVVELTDGTRMAAQYLVGCDGGRSLIRKAAGIEFPGWDPTISWLIAEAQMSAEPRWGFHRSPTGTHAIGKLEEEGRLRVSVVLTEQQLHPGGEPSFEEVRAALVAAFGTDYGIHTPTYVSRFTDMTRQAAAYRERRVLLAGDAAHVHPPVGGQGLNIGLQDAVNLGWKLALVAKRLAPESLLDTYQAERHPVAARVLRNTMAQISLRRTDERSRALAEIVSGFLEMSEPRKDMAARMSGLDIRYDLGDGHPLLGRRMPDLELLTASGSKCVFELLHAARPVLLNLGEPGALDIAPWADRVRSIDAKCAGSWELPAIGTVCAPTAVLIRPDGYVAWVGQQGQPALAHALTKWFGPAETMSNAA